MAIKPRDDTGQDGDNGVDSDGDGKNGYGKWKYKRQWLELIVSVHLSPVIRHPFIESNAVLWMAPSPP